MPRRLQLQRMSVAAVNHQHHIDVYQTCEIVQPEVIHYRFIFSAIYKTLVGLIEFRTVFSQECHVLRPAKLTGLVKQQRTPLLKANLANINPPFSFSLLVAFNMRRLT